MHPVTLILASMSATGSICSPRWESVGRVTCGGGDIDLVPSPLLVVPGDVVADIVSYPVQRTVILYMYIYTCICILQVLCVKMLIMKLLYNTVFAGV